MKTIRGICSGALQALKERLDSITADPEKVRLGYAFGVFLASTPFIGLKVFIALFFTTLFKWNKVSALIGVFHVNLFTAPFFYGFAFLVGNKVLGCHADFTCPDRISLVAFIEIFRNNIFILYSLLLGGLLLGIPMAIGAYCLAKYLTSKPRNAPVPT